LGPPDGHLCPIRRQRLGRGVLYRGCTEVLPPSFIRSLRARSPSLSLSLSLSLSRVRGCPGGPGGDGAAEGADVRRPPGARATTRADLAVQGPSSGPGRGPADGLVCSAQNCLFTMVVCSGVAPLL
jgi:hypothetical protein